MTKVRPELLYTLTTNAENMQARLYINGAPLLLYADIRPMLVTVPITEALTPGQNTVTIDYEPLNVEEETFTPHEGVKLQVILDRRSNLLDDTARQVSESVHLFSGGYDITTGQMEAEEEESVFGQGPLRSKDGGLTAGPVRIAPTEMQFSDRVSDGHAMRVTMQFPINDTPMPTPPWIGSPKLSDTDQLRKELVARYKQLHDIIARGAEAEFRHEMRFVYRHYALALGYRDADALADAIRSNVPLGPGPGTKLTPIPADLMASQLEFGSESRMVRFLPSPLGFQTPDGESAGAYRVFFGQIDQKLEVCFQQSIPS